MQKTMIDSHAHIDFEQFNQDREKVIQHAFDSGVEKIINVGADMKGSQRSVELANDNEKIFAAVGLHPHVFNEMVASQELSSDQAKTIQELSSEMFSNLKMLAQNKKVIAIGEVGLDYFSHGENPISNEQRENQKKGFITQIELVRELNLPVIIHCRDAYVDTYEIIKNYPNQKFVFHCYGGDLEFTQKLLQHGNIFFSFTGNITYVKDDSGIIDSILAIPMERIMLETDCPYLAPVPHRGKRNEPAYVVYVCEKIAEIKQISAKEVDRITTENANKFFNLA